MTAAPSSVPTVAPTGVPTSTVPTAAPTITGSIAFVELNRIVTESLSDNEISDLVALAEDTFGVNPGNVEAEVSYEITGTVTVATDTDVSMKNLPQHYKILLLML